MCLQNEIVEALHAVTTELKAVQEHRDDWLKSCDAEIAANDGIANPQSLPVTRAEAERIFADRISALEARLREQGWERKIRVESPLPGDQK